MIDLKLLIVNANVFEKLLEKGIESLLEEHSVSEVESSRRLQLRLLIRVTDSDDF